MVGSTETLIDLLRQILEAQRETNRLLRQAAAETVPVKVVRPPPSLAIKLGVAEIVAVANRDDQREAGRTGHAATLRAPPSSVTTNSRPGSGE